ncbi:MAG: aminopeptidase [Christensenellales bacterium]|nr:aminopeptidase [Christensenellales bacterium]
MRDVRVDKLANMLVNYSVSAKPGDNVLVEVTDCPTVMTTALIREIYAAGAVPFVWNNQSAVSHALAKGYTPGQLDLKAEVDAQLMKQMQCYIGITAAGNDFQMSDIGIEKLSMRMQHYNNKVHRQIRVPLVRWCGLRFPTSSMAQNARMSTEAFEDFFFDVCTMDYSRLKRAALPLADLMARTDRVHIKGPGTDLRFSIKGMPSIPCAGESNVPDGEVFSAPVRDSVNGIVTYNTPSMQNGMLFENVSLTFEKGRIVKATSSNTEELNKILDTDEGARYIGEFSIGINPYLTDPIRNTLFDEKITGSFHFTPGNCYDVCYNGNKSAIHWDLISIQRPEYGGGEIWFDDVLVRKDGRFVLPELNALNPENLK